MPKLSSRSRRVSLLLSAALAGGLGACGGHAHGEPTETVCPTPSTLTWENFGQTFMTTYCTGCHASTLSGSARNGAPAFHDFDTALGVRRVADHVDEMAGAGPAATNELMPPDGQPQPTLAERQQLAEWIACGAPSMGL